MIAETLRNQEDGLWARRCFISSVRYERGLGLVVGKWPALLSVSSLVSSLHSTPSKCENKSLNYSLVLYFCFVFHLWGGWPFLGSLQPQQAFHLGVPGVAGLHYRIRGQGRSICPYISRPRRVKRPCQ